MEPYIIGETAYNHEGDFEYLIKMVDDMAEMGLNAVKFHLLLNPESYVQKNHPLVENYKKWSFSRQQWSEIITRSEEKNLDVIALCDDVESVEYINQKHSGIKAVELHSTGLNDYFLLREVLNFPGQIILGVGGSIIDEIELAVSFLRNNGKQDILLMYGYQTYPTNYSEINLAKMLKIKELFGLPVGYADHTAYDDKNNVNVSVAAAAMGINILEKHYTPDFGVNRIDFHSAVGKEHMLEIIERMQLYLSVYGTGSLSMSPSELVYGNTGPMKKAIVAKRPIKSGEKLSLDNLWFKRTREESTIKQNQFSKLIGLKATKDIDEDEIIDFSKVEYVFKEMGNSDFGVGDKE